ncbi:MAG TPA: DNA primase [Flavobacteriaceae bacterium]|nr:DNA primase [Flavobacteriaceae bacterium]
MMISKETIDKVFEVSNILEVAQEITEMKKTGANYVGLSPFKDESTPSFTVSPSKGIWKCFGSGEGGNTAVSLLMRARSMSYPDAIKHLANKYAIKIEYDKDVPKEVIEKRKNEEELQKVMEASILRYHHEFMKLPDDHPAVQAWLARGFEKEDATAYKIGYAPGNYLYPILSENGLVSAGKKLGLIDEQKNYDKLHDRLIFPITKNGKILGYGGRKLDDESKYPKWVNSMESEVYNKETVLFGFDEARNEIASTKTVFIVEGYTDVIAFQLNGIKNVVAISGTALSNYQIAMLKRIANRVVLCLDRDEAGEKATIRALEQLLKAEMITQVLHLPFGDDPNDYTIEYHRRIKDDVDVVFTLDHIKESNKPRIDGYEYYIKNLLAGKDDYAIGHEVKKHLKMLTTIKDSILHNSYLDKLANISGIRKTDIKKWMDTEVVVDDNEMYSLPARFRKDLEKYRPTIEKYQLFMAGNQIYVQRGNRAPYSFQSVSNFEIEIVQHMQDDEYPRKLVRIKNVYNYERVFDMPSSDINYPQSFENSITNHGNFRWTGSKNDLDTLKTYLFDQMGTGRMIEVLGWQPEGFWVWNNRVTIPGEDHIELDSSGMFIHNDVTYYVPSANATYKNVVTKYSPQKKFIYQKSPYTFLNFTSMMYKVHREHAITGILFSIASAFQDVVEGVLDSFPMIFLYGPPSSGKDQLGNACQTFFGVRQTAQNLEGGANSMVAQLRKYAQFCNAIHQLSEYKPGDEKLDGRLKGLWDRDGYERGTITSMVSTHNVPILCSTIMTGNFSPEQEALITRLIWENMDKTVFTEEEAKNYGKFSDMLRHGASNFIDEALHLRPIVEQTFLETQREFEQTLKQRVKDVNSRMAMNLSVLGAFYQIFQNTFTFPFSHKDMMDHFVRLLERQMVRLHSSSLTVRFWECFLASMRGQPTEQIRLGHDFKIEGEHMYFNLTSCYLRIQRQWFTQYRQAAPSRATIVTALRECTSYVEEVKSTRMDSGRDARNTSAMVVDLQLIELRSELINAASFQSAERNPFGENTSQSVQESLNLPATHQDKKKGSDEDLPF